MKRLLPSLVAFFAATGLAAAGPVDYLRDVKPILAKHCASCHGSTKQKAGLRLDTAAAALKGGNSGAVIVAGNGAQSLLVKALTGADDAAAMPFKQPRLPAAQIALLKAWIDQGARAPAHEAASVGETRGANHWSFKPLVRPAEPAVKNQGWVRNPIDRFILARLETEGLTPSPEADRPTLIRRLSLDLLGLPPSVEEVEAFVNDRQPDAYERLVDRLLQSPHYGERWGRHWLDLARYADSNGFNIDAPRSIWKFRDWVIDALNRDLPFDQFTIQQIAGDLLPNPTLDQQIATGFHRNTLLNQEGGIDVEQFRVESVVDRVNTTGAVWLGLTVGCCQCHDHKFDPLTQKEYYQLFAFFNNADEPVLELPTAEQQRQRNGIRARIAALKQQLRDVDTTSPARQAAWEKALSHKDRLALPAKIRDIVDIPEDQREPEQKKLLAAAFRDGDRVRHLVGGLGSPLNFLMAAHLETALFRVNCEKQIAALRKSEPAVVSTLVMQERGTPRVTHVHIKGDFLRKGARVEPGVPAVLPPLPAVKKPNRLDLAQWLVDPKNPLTPRVTVNRLWERYFGAGLVETENDFGTQGTPPTNPELLDWLASEFVDQESGVRSQESGVKSQESGVRGQESVSGGRDLLTPDPCPLTPEAKRWSLKTMHRLIVTSATYRQSSRSRPGLAAIDPRNRLLARQNRVRLEAETIRDVSLDAGGLLSPHIGGPSVFPPQPAGVFNFTQIQRDWKADRGPNRYRRGLYTYFWRSAPYPALTVFDAPDSTTTCTRRNRSNTPLQALTLLNDESFFECAQSLAVRVVKEARPDERLRHAFLLCLARPPCPREEQRLGQLLDRQLAEFAATPQEAKQIARAGAGADVKELAAWTVVARVLLNLDEFITRE